MKILVAKIEGAQYTGMMGQVIANRAMIPIGPNPKTNQEQMVVVEILDVAAAFELET